MKSKNPKSGRNTVSKKKRNLPWFKILSIILFIGGLLILPEFWPKEPWKFQSKFGIRLPVRHSLHGIDVSHYQGSINWQKVDNARSGDLKLNFCYVKATEGTTHIDDRFNQNWQALKKTSLKQGAYHFFIPWANADVQARHFLNVYRFSDGDMPPVLDFEKEGNPKNNRGLAEKLKQWLDHVENKTGLKPIIYTNKHLYLKYIKGNFPDHKLWIADYLSLSLRTLEDEPNLVMWQHSEKGKVAGIKGNVDFNVFLGKDSEFEELCIP